MLNPPGLSGEPQHVAALHNTIMTVSTNLLIVVVSVV